MLELNAALGIPYPVLFQLSLRRSRERGEVNSLMYDLTMRLRVALQGIPRALVSRIVMHPAQEMAIENESLLVVATLSNITLAGVPIESNIHIPPDEIVGMDSQSDVLFRIKGLPVPQM